MMMIPREGSRGESYPVTGSNPELCPVPEFGEQPPSVLAIPMIPSLGFFFFFFDKSRPTDWSIS